MSPDDFIRYYRHFRKGVAPGAIPVSKVHYLFITLPFATNCILLYSPFDLHVLAMPPAFVLSQDQTLRKSLRSTDRPTTRVAGSDRVIFLT
jgi:hypothetical protein